MSSSKEDGLGARPQGRLVGQGRGFSTTSTSSVSVFSTSSAAFLGVMSRSDIPSDSSNSSDPEDINIEARERLARTQI